MKKLLYLAFLISSGALAQVSSPSVVYQANAPSGACSPYPPIQVVSSTGVIYTCNNGTWAAASSGGGGSAAINPFQPTTMAEYKLGGLTGTTVPDSSGNNRTATLGTGAGAPTPQPYGMVYNGPFGTTTNYAGGVQYFTVPASMPDYGTFIANVCYDPGPTTWFPGLPASSGDLLGTDYSQTDKGHEVWADGPNAVSINPGYGSVANGSFVSAQSSFQGGCGVFIYTRDTSDRFFWNGTEVQYSQTGTVTSNKPTTGYTVGGTPNGFNRGFTGVISHVMFLSSVLTPAQIPAVIAYSNQVISTYPGIPQPATPSSTFSSQIQGVGDSLMCGWNGSSCSISPFVYISTSTSYAFNNFGVGKQWCEDVQGFSGLKQDLSYSTGSPSITAVLCGTNNIISSSESAATIFAREMSLVSRIKRINPATRVLLFTKYSTTSSADDLKVEALAQLERTGASQYGYQLFDAQAIPAVGAANAYAGACFIDGVHPTQACVQADVSPYLSNKINQMDGSGVANPTVYSSNAVTMAPADNYATIIPTAAATATLPECLGLTGSVYQIFNASAGANTISFSGLSGEAISGGATLAQNAAAVFQVTLVSPTTGGCGWQRVQVATAAQVGADPAGAASTVQGLALLKANNLSDLPNVVTARQNLGLNSPFLSQNAFGDSITWGFYASSPLYGYPYWISQALGFVPWNNFGYPGYNSYNMGPIVLAAPFAYGPTDLITYTIGTNQAQLNTSNQQLDYLADIQAQMAWWLFPTSSKIKFATGSVTYTGTWTTGGQAGFGKQTVVSGSTATFSGSGTNLYVVTDVQQAGTSTGTGTLSCDGTPTGAALVFIPVGNETLIGGISTAQSLTRVSGLAAGSHTCVITSTSSGTVSVEWAGFYNTGSKTTSPYVIMGSVPNQQGNNNSANITLLRGEQTTAISNLQSDGWANVGYANTSSIGGSAQPNLYGDNAIHFNDYGYYLLAGPFISEINTLTGQSFVENNFIPRAISNLAYDSIQSVCIAFNSCAYGSISGQGISGFTGQQDTVLGIGNLQSATTAAGDTSMGFQSQRNVTTGNFNTSMGRQALQDVSTGIGNSAFGYQAGLYPSPAETDALTTDTYMTLLGAFANKSTVSILTGSTAVGQGAHVSQSNQMMLGAPEVTSTTLQGAVVAPAITSPSISAAPLATPSAPVVTNLTAGSSTWAYVLVGRNSSGGFVSAASAAGTLTTGQPSLSSSITNKITFPDPFPAGTQCFDIYRTVAATSPTTLGKIASCATTVLGVPAFTDTGLAGDGTTAPTVATGGAMGAVQYSTTVTTITASATPALVATSGLQTITLSANATPTISGIATGQRITFQICQPASGGPYTWTWPASVHGGMTIGTTASTCSMQSFDSFTGTTLVPESTGVVNIAP